MLFIKNRHYISLTRIVVLFIALITVVAITPYVIPSPKTGVNTDVVSGSIGGISLHIPRDYFHDTPSFYDNTVFLVSMYPSFSPPQGNRDTLWKTGEWMQNIRILIEHNQSSRKADDLAAFFIDHFDATEFSEKSYGLIHQTQPQGKVKDHSDVWLSPGDGVSQLYSAVITCTEAIIETDVPQCSLYYYDSIFRVKASFRKTLLPEWRSIQLGINRLIDSFLSPQSASDFRTQALAKTSGDL